MHLEKRSKETSIALVGGGTGGHIFPLVAIGQQLQTEGKKFIYIGGSGSLEERIIGGQNWKFEVVSAGKWRRYYSLKSIGQNVIDIVRTIVGIYQGYRLLKKYRVKTVFSKGGFVALPVVIAAWLSRTRVIVHESDSVMGLTNRITASLADKVLTAFSTETYANAKSNFIQVGIPIRLALRQASKLKAPKKSRPLLLILPGSQGSMAINNLLKPIISNLVKNFDIIHLTGEKDYQAFSALKEKLPQKYLSHYRPYQFIDRELPYYYQSADLVVARSSATTIAEAALFKRACYLIPLPTAASDHQSENAKRLVAANAAISRSEYQLSPNALEAEIQSLLTDPEKLTLLGENLSNYFIAKDSLQKIMEVING